MKTAVAIPSSDPRLELILRMRAPLPIERLAKGSLLAMGDPVLAALFYGAYLEKWLARHRREPDAPFKVWFASLRLWRVHAWAKTGRWPAEGA